MSAESDTPADPVGSAESEQFDEVREAAGAVVASLKWLIEAAERVVENPDAFAKAVGNGRSVVEAFVGGFTAQAGNSATSTENSATSTENSATSTENSATSTERGGESDSNSGGSTE